MRSRRPLRSLIAVAAAAALAVSGAVAAAAPASASPAQLPFAFTNDTGRTDALYLYVVGTDLGSGRLGWVDAAGTFRAWPPGANPPSPAPDASQPGPGNGGSSTVRVPKDFSGRIYFSFGRKIDFRLTPGGLVQPAPWSPADPNYSTLLDWSELTYNGSGLFINSSQVDMFAIPHTVSVTGSNGQKRSTGTVVANGRDNVINGLRAQPGWGDTVVTSGSEVLRVLAPGKAAGAGRFSPTYLDGYITSAWDAYRSKTLTVVPFGDQPNTKFFGRTSGNDLVFTNTSGARVASFAKPSTSNVWGCDGTLQAPNDAVVGPIARTLCAGLVRGTLGTVDVQPSTDASQFYRNSAPDWYARLIHQNMADGRAYAFAFDDVGGFESLVTDGDPSSAGITLNPFRGASTAPGGGTPVGSTLVSALNGRCIDVPGSRFVDGARLQMWDCNSSPAQSFVPDAGRLRSGGLCMDAAGAATGNGTPIQLATCSTNRAQQFVLSGAGDLVNVAANRCVDIKDVNRELGATLQLWDCAGTPNQKWTRR